MSCVKVLLDHDHHQYRNEKDFIIEYVKCTTGKMLLECHSIFNLLLAVSNVTSNHPTI